MNVLRPRRIGHVRTFFHGRLVVGPDWRVMVTTMCFIAVGSLLFVCYTNTVNSARAVVGVFGALSLALITVCGLRDPGLCPKELPPPIDAPPHEPLEARVAYINFDGTAGTATLERKWCYSCNLYRPVRAVHCRFCDVCVCRRDHHCPWTGICIGARNYFVYFLLVWCALVLTLTATIGGIMSISKRVDAVNARQDVAHIPSDIRRSAIGVALTETYCIEVFLLAFSALWVMLVGTLATFHLYLALHNKTSGDDARHGGDGGKCFNRGSVLRNMRDAFFPPASVMYDGGSLAARGDEWTVAVEEDDAAEDLGPHVIPNQVAAAERSKRREATDVLVHSASLGGDGNV